MCIMSEDILLRLYRDAKIESDSHCSYECPQMYGVDGSVVRGGICRLFGQVLSLGDQFWLRCDECRGSEG